jgi:hypothetical protein
LEKQIPHMYEGLQFFRDLSFDAAYYQEPDPDTISMDWNRF